MITNTQNHWITPKDVKELWNAWWWVKFEELYQTERKKWSKKDRFNEIFYQSAVETAKKIDSTLSKVLKERWRVTWYAGFNMLINSILSSETQGLDWMNLNEKTLQVLCETNSDVDRILWRKPNTGTQIKAQNTQDKEQLKLASELTKDDIINLWNESNWPEMIFKIMEDEKI